VLRVCVTYKTGFGFDDRIYWAYYNTSQITIFDWTLSTSDHSTLILQSESGSYITTDGQSASLSCSKAPMWGLRPYIYYCGFANAELSLWREDESVVYNCCWASPAQSFSGPSPVGLVTIFYCLRFETSRFIASSDSQGHGGGIRPRLHTGFSVTVKVKVMLRPTVQSASLSWNKAPIWGLGADIYLYWRSVNQ
jgi:hypothetical protein